MTAPYDAIEEMFASEAANRRYGEVVTIAEHMLQSAACAESEGANDATVVAALLHDVGHLLPAVDSDDRNRRHANSGADWLVELGFGDDVTMPVRLHIPAKRYLVATEPDYFDSLSPASVHTLGLQGGPFTDAECDEFVAHPHAEVAQAVRRWDEAGKDEHVEVPGLPHYRERIERLTQSR